MAETPEIITFDDSTKTCLDDGLSELTLISVEISFWMNKLDDNKARLKAILYPYCRCSKTEFDDYLQGNGLISIENRMQQVKPSKADAGIISRENAALSLTKASLSEAESRFDSTLLRLAAKMRDHFIRLRPLVGLSSNQYRIDYEGYRFALFAQNEIDRPSFKTAIEKAFSRHLDKFTKDIEATRERLQKETGSKAPIKPRMRRSQPKQKPPSQPKPKRDPKIT